MNKADSDRLGSALEQLGLQEVERAGDADVVVLNSCVVRQNAEDKVANNLFQMRPVKKQRPETGAGPDGLHGWGQDRRPAETVSPR